MRLFCRVTNNLIESNENLFAAHIVESDWCFAVSISGIGNIPADSCRKRIAFEAGAVNIFSGRASVDEDGYYDRETFTPDTFLFSLTREDADRYLHPLVGRKPHLQLVFQRAA